MNTFVALDWETGGVTMDESILAGFFGILDENLCLVDELTLNVKPDDGRYIVTAQAMSVNRINLIEHDKIAIPYKAAKGVLYEFLKKSYQGEKLIPVGHGVRLDIDWTKHYLAKTYWEDFCSYRSLCTSSASQFLRAGGRFPKEVSGSLGSLCDYFGIKPIGDMHNARVDTLQTVSVLRALLNLINTK